ncbi:MAG: carbamoyltransferase HypF [Bacteroidales bacterium]
MTVKVHTLYNTFRIQVQGRVQGVGFRPFIYRLASEHKLNGQVENRNDGVLILLNCRNGELEEFVNHLRAKAPPASFIDSIHTEEVEHIHFEGFEIVKSSSVSDTVTEVSPDIAVCPECLEDMKTQVNRIDYPFVNCTNCGPRFSIIQNLPYDRAKTTMAPFEMCPECHKEYTDILDRRFHAQPVACSRCGPSYRLHKAGEEVNDPHQIVEETVHLLANQGIVAIKGLGGFFIACDPFCEDTVSRLRQLKSREGKPFAVMFRDTEALRQFAHTNQQEEDSLQSLKRPIVLLKDKKKLAPSVNMGFDTLGAMLPYMPLHHLLFEQTRLPALVLTSGNISDEPIITDNHEAVRVLGRICDAVLTYNREIHNRTDDSVVRVIHGKERVFRRSRGYAPIPVKVSRQTEGILATGAELVNCFCIGKGNQALLSQHIGDLKNMETYRFFTESVDKYRKLFRFNPSLIATDTHPDYLSSRYAEDHDIPVVRIQHHHAHIASCMAEHGLDEKVIGVALDGTGYGDDGHTWGSEFMVCDFNDYRRITHFDYMQMPGGDKVTQEPWRMAVSLLYNIYGRDFHRQDPDFLKNIDKQQVNMLCQAMDAGINTPLSSGAGRLFDGVSALINLCTHSRFHAEAPMRLESVIDKNVTEAYPFRAGETISFRPAMDGILRDLENNQPIPVISARFHNTIVKVVEQSVQKISDEYGLQKVVLSGGTFQNKYLGEQLENRLLKAGFEVFTHGSVPSNDGGIALGQLMIAAAKRNKVSHQ